MASLKNLKRQHHMFLFLVSSIILAISVNLIVTYLYRRITRMKPISQFKKPKTIPKYFAIDIDDTFYAKNEESMAKNVEAFKYLKSKGITPFFCTGRDLNNTFNLLGDEFFRDTQYYGYPGVYVNGALVYDESGNIIKLEKFTLEFLKKFKKFIVDNKLLDKTVFFTENGRFALSPLYQDGVDFMNRHKMKQPTVISFEELTKKKVVSITFPSEKFNIAGLEKDVDYKVKYCYKVIAQLSPSTCNKKDGVKALMEKFGADPYDVAYIGDGYNDIEAMGFCGTSFAVGNAKEEVKKEAEWVVDLTCEEGAFAKVVDCLYK